MIRLIGYLIGFLLLANGFFALIGGRSWIWWVLGGLLVIGAGQGLSEWLKRAGDDIFGRRRKIGARDEACPVTGKVKYATREDAEEEIRRNEMRHRQGRAEYLLRRAYECEHCAWWHTTSKPPR